MNVNTSILHDLKFFGGFNSNKTIQQAKRHCFENIIIVLKTSSYKKCTAISSELRNSLKYIRDYEYHKLHWFVMPDIPILVTHVNSWLPPKGMSFFEVVDRNKDGIVTEDEGLTNPNKYIVKEWVALLQKLSMYFVKRGITRREFHDALRSADGNNSTQGSNIDWSKIGYR